MSGPSRRDSFSTVMGDHTQPGKPQPPSAQDSALKAIRWAAERLGVPASEVRAADYRLLRSRDRRLPSEASVRVAFGGPHRARERSTR